MPKTLRIFIGSSSEAKDKAEILQELLFEQGPDIQPKAWWAQGVFPVGSTFIDSLRLIMNSTDAALLLATEDDQTMTRGKEVFEPRDNIPMEYGMSIEAHGPERTALAVLGEPKLPSNVSGVAHLYLQKGCDLGDFKERNRGKIRSLIEQWRRSSREPAKPGLAPAPLMRTSEDTSDALALVDELVEYRDDLLSNTNLVRRYQINRIAIPMLCKRINQSSVKPGSGPLVEIVTLAAYTEFETKNCWQLETGYRYQTDLVAGDGTEAVSGVTDKEKQELKEAAGADPRQVSPSPHEAVRGVSWYDAAVYCLFARGRLPTREELIESSSGEQKTDLWEWSQSWFSEEEAHIAVARRGRGRKLTEFIGVNPDLRLPQIGFRLIR
jgi:hypothetical protein